jgi:hypothetical protein
MREMTISCDNADGLFRFGEAIRTAMSRWAV